MVVQRTKLARLNSNEQFVGFISQLHPAAEVVHTCLGYQAV